MTTLFLAWQDPHSRRWFTVGRLDAAPDQYSFSYTNGAKSAAQNAGIEPNVTYFASFTSLAGPGPMRWCLGKVVPLPQTALG